MLFRMKRRKDSKGKIAGIFGSISGIGSIISAHNICHTLCLVAVAVLSVFGIMASSDILMFLEDYNLLFWSMGMFFLALSLFLYTRFKGCISRKLILINIGLLTIGIPFFQGYNIILWVMGGIIIGGGIFWYAKDKIVNR